MVKTLTRHGNSYALLIDRPIMELLGIEPDTPLELTTDGHSLIITPAGSKRARKFRKAMDKTMKEYGKTLKRLAP